MAPIPIPALTRPWTSRRNRPDASTASALLIAQSRLFALKEHLKDTATGGTTSGTRNAASVWVTKGSCDGTTVNTSGTDLITSHTTWLWAAGAHSWWWAENAAVGYQIVIDTAGAASASVCIAFAPISTPFTGGNTTTRPTSTQEFLWGTGSTGAGTVAAWLSDVVTGGSNYTHFVTADDGQFWFLCSRAGTGIFSTVIGFQKPSGATDARAVYAIGNTLSSSRGAMSRAQIIDANTGAMSRSPNGVSTHTGGVGSFGYAGGSNYLGTGTTDANSGKYLSGPVDAWSIAGGQNAWRGRFVDLIAVGARPIGDGFPSVAAQERVVVGDFLLPFPATTALIT